MRTTTIFLAATLLGLAFVAMPLDDLSPVGTADAYGCYLDPDDPMGYVHCEATRCTVENPKQIVCKA